MRCAAFLAALLGAARAQNPPAVLSNCYAGPDAVNFTSFVISPIAPSAGDNVTLRATGTAPRPIAGGAGNIDAYLFGMDVFNTPIATCGAGQAIDVLGLATGNLDALACPLAAGAPAAVTFSIGVPSEAFGLGTLNIIVNASDAGKLPALCINLTITL